MRASSDSCTNATPGREASRARSEALSRVRRSQPTGADRFAVLDDHLRAGVLNAPRTRNASRCRTERRTSTRQQRALRRACQLAEVAVDSVRRDLRHHQTQVSRRCTDGCTGAAPQLERTSGWGYSLGANPIRRQEPRCPDRCCDSQRIRCTRTALVFPVPPESSLFDQTNSLFRGVGNSKRKPHDISGLGGFDTAYSRPNPRNSLFFPCKTGKSGQRRVRSRLRPPPPTCVVDITALFSIPSPDLSLIFRRLLALS